MNIEQRQIETPALTKEQVQLLCNWANEKLPTMYGNHILSFVERIAMENEEAQKAKEVKPVEEVKEEASN